MRTSAGVTLLALAAMVMSGCAEDTESSATDPVARLREKGYDEQADMLADGTVTTAEVEEAGVLLQECFVAAGHGLKLEGWNPIDNVIYLYLAESADGVSLAGVRSGI